MTRTTYLLLRVLFAEVILFTEPLPSTERRGTLYRAFFWQRYEGYAD
jgi:hypothetical protein